MDNISDIYNTREQSSLNNLITYFMLAFIVRNEAAIRAMADEEMLAKFKFLFEELLFNREMMVLAAAFAITIMVVYIVRRMPVDHCWTMAIVAGTLTDIVVILVGDLIEQALLGDVIVMWVFELSVLEIFFTLCMVSRIDNTPRSRSKCSHRNAHNSPILIPVYKQSRTPNFISSISVIK